MKEIRLGLEAGVDVISYAKSELDWEQMKEIRLSLGPGISLCGHISLFGSEDENSSEATEGTLKKIDLF